MANMLRISRLQGSVKRSLSGWPDHGSAGSHLTGWWDVRRALRGVPEARAVVSC